MKQASTKIFLFPTFRRRYSLVTHFLSCARYSLKKFNFLLSCLTVFLFHCLYQNKADVFIER